MKRKRGLIILLLMIIWIEAPEVYAGKCVLDIKVEGKGVQAEVYQIGEVDSDGFLRLDNNPEKLFPLSNARDIKNVISYLDEFVIEKALITKESDANGRISVLGLDKGAYYIRFSGGEYDREYVSSLVHISNDSQKIYPKYEESRKEEIIETEE